jgi:DNA invertase Pin-like site-specific DNA recombinase
MKHIAIYARSNEPTGSIQGYQKRNCQIEACLDLASEMGYPVENIKIFQDDGVCGSRVLQDGEAMKSMLNSIDSISLLIVSTLSRISRNDKELVTILNIFKQAGTRVCDVHGGDFNNASVLQDKNFRETFESMLKMEEKLYRKKFE